MGNTAIDGIDNQELYSRYNALQTHIYDAVEILQTSYLILMCAQ
jgi:hypothetical protein